MPETQKLSRVAKNPVLLPEGVTVHIADNILAAQGPKGVFQLKLHPLVAVACEGQYVRVHMTQPTRAARAQAGTARALIHNAVQGVYQAFQKRLELVGLGYRAKVEGKILTLLLGFSHPVIFPFPDDIDITVTTVDGVVVVVVEGIDKQKVGQISSNIRALRPPEPYKGKGIRYSGETILRKEVNKK